MRTNERTNERSGRLALALSCVLASLWAASCATSNVGEPSDDFVVDEVERIYPPTVVDGYRRFDRFLPDDEAGALVETFDWASTEEVPELGADGLPTLYYVVVRVTDIEQTDLLERASVAWSVMPFFESEQPLLPDEPVVLAASGAHGSFVFAMMPGSIYNLARRSALEGRPVFEIVSLRTPPSEASVHADGSLDLEWLVERGFEWPAPYATPAMEGETGLSSAALSEALTDFTELIVAAGYESYLATVAFISNLIRLTGPTAGLRLSLTVSTPDADWVPAMSPMLRTWGNQRPITTQGQRTLAIRENGFGIYRSSNTLSPGGLTTVTTFRVPDNASYRVCYESRIGTLRVIDYALPTTVCTPPIAVPAGIGTAGGPVTLAAQDLQTLAVAFDALQYMGQFQIPIRPPVIASGQLSIAMTVGENGFVFGHGGRDPASLLLINATDAILTLAATGVDVTIGGALFSANDILSFFGIPPIVPGAPPIAPLILPIKSLYNVDIIWPPGNTSRVVIAHEVGHHLFYQLMVNAELSGLAPPGTFAAAMLQIIFGTILPRNPQNPFFEAVAVNEGVADFFASQLSGGSNRLTTAATGLYAGDQVGSGGGVGEFYCAPPATTGATDCFEFNFTGAEGVNALNDRASRISTLLVDLVDDLPPLPGGGIRQHGGTVWVPTTCPTSPAMCPLATPQGPLPGPTAGAAEESLNVSTITVFAGMSRWMLESPALTVDFFMRGVTRELRGVGISDPTSCTVYALHTAGAVCDPNWLP